MPGVRTLALVDGEHYPPVTRWALDESARAGHAVVAALLVGGSEKLGRESVPDLGVPVLVGSPDPEGALADAIDELRPEVILDLSDEPVLGYRERMALASVALARDVAYQGPDFRLDPPRRAPAPAAPCLAVIGTGKRTGKTAIAGQAARVAVGLGLEPVIVAMGRGGPPEPEMIEPGAMTIEALLGRARIGGHAASDYLEDAMTTGVATVGARRAGGGLAGATYASNVEEAVALADARRPDLVVLEGSGAAVPPVRWDAGVLVVPASAPPEYLGGYLGPYRLLLSDLVVVTMGSSPTGLEGLSSILSHVRRYLGDSCVVTDFVPVPLADVRGVRAFFVTTAPRAVAARQAAHLESAHGCTVVGWSDRLADRARLEEELDAAQGYDVLLAELKAAAVDVAAERAVARGAEVVFVDNRAETLEGSIDLDEALGGVIRSASERGAAR